MNKVKNMLCIVLALAMMLIPMSVCAAPADGKTVALHMTADKTTVAPGDTITLSVTYDVADWDSVWGLPCYYLMYNDAIFAPHADFKTDKTTLRMPMGDLGEFVVPENGLNNTITTSNYNAVKNKFATSGESADDYTGGVMMTFAVNNDGGYTAAGGIQYTDADTVQVEFYLTVAEDAAPGTYKVGLPYAAYLANKAYVFCCDTGKAVRVASSAIDVSDAVVEITVGSAATPLEVSYWKDQIRFNKYSDGSYAGSFDYRILASIDNFDEVYADVAAAEASIKDVGFIFNKGAAIDEATAKAQVEGGAATYSQVKNVYVSTYFSAEKGYVMSCMVENIPDADVGTSLSAMAYVIYEQNGETMYAYSPVQTSTFTTLYNTYYSQAFPA